MHEKQSSSPPPSLPTSLAELKRTAEEQRDPNSRILYPRFSCPAFVNRGSAEQPFLYLSLSREAAAFEIRLVHGHQTLVSEQHERPFANGEVEVLEEVRTRNGQPDHDLVRVPLPSCAGIDPGGITPYMLAIHVSALLKDGHHPIVRSPKSLVLMEPREDLTFSVMSDFHFHDAKVKIHDRRKTAIALSRKAMRLSRNLDNQFVLVAGDLASYVFLYSRCYPAAQTFFRNESPLPNCIVPGNHDGYILGTTETAWLDGLRIWRRRFGPTYHSFAIGNRRFIGLNSYDWKAEDRNLLKVSGAIRGRFNQAGKMGKEQLKWFEEELALSRERDEQIYVYVHHNPLHRRFKRATGKLHQFGGWQGSEREDVVRIIREGGVLAVFSGHEHFEQYEELDGIPFYTGASIGGVHDRGEFWGFRSVRLSDGTPPKVVSHRLF